MPGWEVTSPAGVRNPGLGSPVSEESACGAPPRTRPWARVFHVDFHLKPEHAGPMPGRRDLEVRLEELGYFGIELVTETPHLGFVIRCGTEGRALELAGDIQRRVLFDEDGSRYQVRVAPVG